MVALMVTLRKDCDEVTGQMFQLLSSNIMSQKLILFLICFGYHFFFLLAISFHWGHIKSLRDICFRLCLSDWWVSSSTRLSHGGYHLFISSQIHPGSYKQIKYLFCFILFLVDTLCLTKWLVKSFMQQSCFHIRDTIWAWKIHICCWN